MRFVVGIMCIFLAIGTAASAQEKAPSRRIVFQLNDNRGGWADNLNPKKEGRLNLLYFSLGYISPTYGLTMLGSQANADYIYNGGNPSGDFHISTLLDSTLSGYYLFKNIAGFDLRTGLDLNLPTGNASFDTAELNTLFTDNVTQELNLVTSFGKGLNVAPNMVLSRVFMQRLVAGFGVRYEVTGEYDPTRDTPDDDYNPGDNLTLIASLQYLLNKKTIFFFDINSSYATRDKQNREEVFKTGDSHNFNLRAIRIFEAFRATLSAAYGLQGKNQSLGAGGITTEDRNSNNNNYEFFLNVNFPYTNKIHFSGIAGYKNLLENGYTSDNSLFDGGYRKVYAGSGISYKLKKQLTLSANLRLFQIENKKDAVETADARYRGFNMDLGLIYSLPF